MTYALPTATVGATYPLNILLQDSLTGLNPNLAGYSGDLQIRAVWNSPIVLEASTANGLMTLNSPQGNVGIIFAPVTITTPGTFSYDLKLVDPNGIVSKPIGGAFVITQTYTP